MDELLRIVRLYVNEQKSVRDVGAILGLSDATIRRRLHASGVVMRRRVPRSNLRRLDQQRLFASIAEHGINKTAKRWHIHERRLQRYLAKLRATDERK